MLLPDLINGIFELLAGLFIWFNVYRLYQDKMIKGVSWQATTFFTLWTFYNLYYYPHLNQWISLAGTVVILAANVAWLFLYWIYSRRVEHG